MNNSDSFPGASTPYTSLVSTPHPVPSSASSSTTNTNSRATNRRHIQQYSSSTGPYAYDSDMDLAVHGLHIVDSSHLHPGYKPRRRDAVPHYYHHHQESAADKMSSSSPSSSSTPSPTRLPPFSNSSMNNSSDSNSSPSEDMKVPRKWGVQFYPSLKQRVREEREERDVRRFSGAAKGGRMESARLQIGTTGYNDEDDGGDGDVEMMDVDVLADDGNDWKVAREFERGYDGDTEMGDVPPPSPPLSSLHEGKGAKGVKGASCFGSTTSTGSKKRARGSDQMDEEEEKVEHKRMRSSV